MDSIQIINLILDFVFLGLIIFLIVRNCIRGFLDSLVSLVKIVVAPVFAVIFNLPLARFIAKIFFNSVSSNWVNKLLLTTETVEIIDGVEKTLYDVDAIFEGIPDMVVRFVLRAGEEWENKALIDKFFIGDGTVGPQLATADELGVISDVIGSRIALGIAIIVSFFVIFIFVEVLILILGKLLNKLIEKATVAKVFNVILGGVIGALIGILITWVACFAIGKLFEFGQHYYPDFFLDEYWNGTILVKFFINNDLLELLSKIAIH
ncbi:MAG: CvpA family protein [Clostridia bacterium]|nr:CvpA family protein [Clostridia bacterium]